MECKYTTRIKTSPQLSTRDDSSHSNAGYLYILLKHIALKSNKCIVSKNNFTFLISKKVNKCPQALNRYEQWTLTVFSRTTILRTRSLTRAPLFCSLITGRNNIFMYFHPFSSNKWIIIPSSRINIPQWGQRLIFCSVRFQRCAQLESRASAYQNLPAATWLPASRDVIWTFRGLSLILMWRRPQVVHIKTCGLNVIDRLTECLKMLDLMTHCDK